MSNEVIIAIVGMIGILLGSIVTKWIDFYFKEKSEKNKRRNEAIVKAKKLAMTLSKAVIVLAFYFEDHAKLPDKLIERKTDEDGKVLLKGSVTVHQYLIEDITDLCDKLVELSGIVLTYSETKNLYENLYKSLEDVTKFGLMVENKFRERKFTDDDIEEIKKEMAKIIDQLATVQTLEI